MGVEGKIAIGVTEILKKLSSVVANEIDLVWYFKDELKNLLSTMGMIMAVMEDAEKKQESTPTVRFWMEDLKVIAYDAEDILDEYSYEVILCKHQIEEGYKSTVFNKVHNLFSSSKPSFVASWKFAYKVKKINEKFNKIAKHMNALGLQTIYVGSSSFQHELMMRYRETCSLIDDSNIVGRENEKSDIIKMLLDEEKTSSNQGGGKHDVSVIPIVGMGGLGKTTMAQLVFNDGAVKRHFEIEVWVCVSDPFDIKKLYKDIANDIGIITIQYDDATTMADITRLLLDYFSGKKFMLVLDDIWNVDLKNWNTFKAPFMVGQKGSKILVTTRNEKVALMMVDKFQPYPLGTLKENDCWSLFKEITFGPAGVVETPNLVEIGKKMVKRCGGLPLGVIFLARLMQFKKENDWKIIGDNELWYESGDILPSLKLGYDYLPSHLKLCFSYCCLFPKDSIISRETLIQLWMAEGFLIKSPERNTMSIEQIGNEYFHSLLCNFFFQDVQDYGYILTCKMNYLIHDLAHTHAGNKECLIVAERSAHNVQYISKTRRLHLVNDLDEDMLAAASSMLNEAKELRSLSVKKTLGSVNIGTVINNNKRLRVLDLSETDLEELPPSIGNLKHLRYLDVSHTNIKMLPGSITKLYNLQTLKLDATTKLPEGLDKLINLRHFQYLERKA